MYLIIKPYLIDWLKIAKNCFELYNKLTGDPRRALASGRYFPRA